MSLEGAVVVVTGGFGYVGRRLVDALVREGCREVRAVDVTAPPPDFVSDAEANNHHDDDTSKPKVSSFVVDLGSDYESLLKSLDGADIVFHLASYGMSGVY